MGSQSRTRTRTEDESTVDERRIETNLENMVYEFLGEDSESESRTVLGSSTRMEIYNSLREPRYFLTDGYPERILVEVKTHNSSLDKYKAIIFTRLPFKLL